MAAQEYYSGAEIAFPPSYQAWLDMNKQQDQNYGQGTPLAADCDESGTGIGSGLVMGALTAGFTKMAMDKYKKSSKTEVQEVSASEGEEEEAEDSEEEGEEGSAEGSEEDGEEEEDEDASSDEEEGEGEDEDEDEEGEGEDEDEDEGEEDDE